MHIRRIRLVNFKRFQELTIDDVPATTRLVVLTGPNGTGKSAIFDGLNWWRRTTGGWGVAGDTDYYGKASVLGNPSGGPLVQVEFHEENPTTQPDARRALWIRSAYRHDADFQSTALQRQQPLLDEPGLGRLIEAEQAVRKNYERLVTSVMQAVFDPENDEKSVGGLREEYVGVLRQAMVDVFGDLILRHPGDPLHEGAFHFDKGTSEHFHFKNLSAGERSAFDLLLDMVLKIQVFDDTIYCIDEPELHMGTRTQHALMRALYTLLPEGCQLWIATHSLGMMRAALDLYRDEPQAVVFIDMGGQDFDREGVVLTPATPNRDFWRRSLEIALDDVAGLVAPERVVLCEGNDPASGFDAKCYRTIFADEFPDTEFVSVGGSTEVKGDALGLERAVQVLAPGTQITRLVDRDEHSDEEIETLRSEGVRVLTRRSIESYLLDDEILERLCTEEGHPEKAASVSSAKEAALLEAVGRGRPVDDLKAVRRDVHDALKRELGLTGRGSTTNEFLASTVAPLITADTAVYAQLRQDLFGAYV